MSDSDLPSLVPEQSHTPDVLALPSDSPPPPRNVSGSKRKRVVLSIHDKQQVLQRLESGEQPIAIARTFGISRQQVSDIKKNKERIVAFCIDAKHMSTLKRKTLKATSEYHPGVEQELYRWIIRQRKLGREVTAESLSAKTTDLFMQYSADDTHMPVKSVANWLRQFKKAHGIKALNEDEMQNLPEQFVPAMDMTRQVESVTNSTQIPTSEVTLSSSVEAVTPPGSYLTSTTAISHIGVNAVSGLPTATTTIPMHVPSLPGSTVSGVPASMDMTAFMHVMGAHGDAQPPQVTVEASTASLQVTANTVQQLNAQLERFGREMAVKLDYLDERVNKLCYLVLPTRLG